MKKHTLITFIIAMAVMCPMLVLAGDHPAYVQALEDLRAARWLISEHHAIKGWVQSADEASAIKAIDAAMNEIKKAAIDDHKELSEHTGVIDMQQRFARLHKAIEILRKTRGDVAQREDDKFAQGLKTRVLRQIDEAINLTGRAVQHK